MYPEYRKETCAQENKEVLLKSQNTKIDSSCPLSKSTTNSNTNYGHNLCFFYEITPAIASRGYFLLIFPFFYFFVVTRK